MFKDKSVPLMLCKISKDSNFTFLYLVENKAKLITKTAFNQLDEHEKTLVSKFLRVFINFPPPNQQHLDALPTEVPILSWPKFSSPPSFETVIAFDKILENEVQLKNHADELKTHVDELLQQEIDQKVKGISKSDVQAMHKASFALNFIFPNKIFQTLEIGYTNKFVQEKKQTKYTMLEDAYNVSNMIHHAVMGKPMLTDRETNRSVRFKALRDEIRRRKPKSDN